jgi:hypothetical protein
LVQTLVAHGTEHAALIGVGTFFAVLLLVATLSNLRDVDLAADVPVVAIRLLRSLPLFAPLPGPALESLGRSAASLEVNAGETIIRAGDEGDRYYAIVAGRFDVTGADGRTRSLERGSGFGEVALVADVPRTATVVAGTSGTLLAIDRGPFLTAVTGHAGAARMAWRAAREYAPGVLDGEVV